MPKIQTTTITILSDEELRISGHDDVIEVQLRRLDAPYGAKKFLTWEAAESAKFDLINHTVENLRKKLPAANRGG